MLMTSILLAPRATSKWALLARFIASCGDARPDHSLAARLSLIDRHIFGRATAVLGVTIAAQAFCNSSRSAARRTLPVTTGLARPSDSVSAHPSESR